MKKTILHFLIFLLIPLTSLSFAADSGYALYEDVAKTTGGQVYHLDKKDLKSGKLTQIIIKEARNKQEKPDGNNQQLVWLAYGADVQNGIVIPFSIDPLAAEFSIMLNLISSKANVKLIAPDKSIATPNNISTGNSRILTLSKPAPGIWTLKITGANKINIEIYAMSSMNIHIEPQRLVMGHDGPTYIDSYDMLRAGTKQIFGGYLYSNKACDTLKDFKISLISMNGKVLGSSTAAIGDCYRGIANFFTEPMLIPSDSFRIMLTGTTNNMPFEFMQDTLLKANEPRSNPYGY